MTHAHTEKKVNWKNLYILYCILYKIFVFGNFFFLKVKIVFPTYRVAWVKMLKAVSLQVCW